MNMISPPLPFPCLIKKSFSFPFIWLVILKVDEKPEPPCEAILVVAASRERADKIAGSILGAIAFNLGRELGVGLLHVIVIKTMLTGDDNQMLKRLT